MTGDDERSQPTVTRRGFVTAITATSALAIGGTRLGSADSHGYGLSGYGTDPYGGAEGTTTQLAVSTDGASSVDSTSAVLAGTVTDLESTDSATVYFEWGPSSDGLLHATAEQSVSTTGEFEASLSDLASDTDYEFRAIATADGTTATGSTVTFQTAQEAQTEGTPQIETLTGADVSNPNNPHVDAEIGWEATIDASELYAATLTLSDSTGEIETWNYSLSGQTASATETRRIPYREREEGATYTVDLVVYSYYGNIDQMTTTFEPQ